MLEPARRERLRVRDRDFPEVSDAVRHSIEELPVVICSRSEVWRFLGFKHVNGPQEWDSFAKAEYIHKVHHDLRVPLEVIARTIGDEHDTVARLFRGYNVLAQARSLDLFDPDDCYQRKFPFSHLWTGLGYRAVTDFLGLTRERLSLPDPVPDEHTEDLKQLMLWLFGSRKDAIEPRVQRQNPDLRDLAQALGTSKGVAMLRAGLPLSSAVDATLGDERLFQEALVNAEENLRNAMRYVATGFKGGDDQIRTAASIETIARNLERTMRGMITDREPAAGTDGSSH